MDSMWTKHGFPAERVEKLMENDKARLPQTYPH